MDTGRVDKWIWAIRLFKTRADATAACRGGHVKINGRSAKPAATVRAGDRVHAHVHGIEREVEVVRLIDKRVSAPIAAECYVDHTPPVPEADRDRPASRERGAGRPTKRERRDLDRWRRLV
ncbi:MAG: RNA-binding S4 domain-containing protein [Acidimicrobiales bacterium]|nr:RNA-binding S4 domain-containing protein [Acidimicrobiales bacterium]